MLRAVPTSPPPERVYQRLAVNDRLAVVLIEASDFFQAYLVVTYEGGTSCRYPITGEVSDGEILSSRMHDLKGAVQAMVEAGFALPPAPKVA